MKHTFVGMARSVRHAHNRGSEDKKEAKEGDSSR